MQNESWQILEATAAHLDFLAEFGRQAFIDTYKTTLALADLEEYTATAFAKPTLWAEMQQASVKYLVCVASQTTPCGYAKLLAAPPPSAIICHPAVELQRLYIVAEYKQQGIGKCLLQQAERQAAASGFQCVWLRVWEGNQIAQKIYLKANYAIVGAESYVVGDDARTVLLMCKKL